MPSAKELRVEPIASRDAMGTYLYDDGEKHAHTITISDARCGHLDTVIRTMAHEMIHASRWDTSTQAWLQVRQRRPWTFPKAPVPRPAVHQLPVSDPPLASVVYYLLAYAHLKKLFAQTDTPTHASQ